MAEPVTIAEAKYQCRMSDDNSEDTFLTSLIAPARAYVERVSTYGLVAGTRVFTFTKWNGFLEIFLRPIASLTSVAYVDADGADQTYAGLAPLGAYPFRIFPAVNGEFPAILGGSTITVTVAAGALDSASHEYLIAKRAILILIAHWFEYREAAETGQVSQAVEFTVKSMLDELRPIAVY